MEREPNRDALIDEFNGLLVKAKALKSELPFLQGTSNEINSPFGLMVDFVNGCLTMEEHLSKFSTQDLQECLAEQQAKYNQLPNEYKKQDT